MTFRWTRIVWRLGLHVHETVCLASILRTIRKISTCSVPWSEHPHSHCHHRHLRPLPTKVIAYLCLCLPSQEMAYLVASPAGICRSITVRFTQVTRWDITEEDSSTLGSFIKPFKGKTIQRGDVALYTSSVRQSTPLSLIRVILPPPFPPDTAQWPC